MKGVEDQLPHLPPDAAVTVTVSPTRGQDPTLDLAERIHDLGRAVVPHLSARKFTGRAPVERTIQRLRSRQVEDVFVIAGDAEEPEGPYEGAADLLEEVDGLGHRFPNVGVAGYPEPHPFIPDEVLVQSLKRKLPYATYLATQICYEADTIRQYITDLRARGIDLPIHVGMPGVVDRKRLLRISMRVGLGDSVRFLKKQSKVATKMAAGFKPDELMLELEDLVGEEAGIAGWHIFTFNEVERTEAWRQQVLRGEAT
jgi:methylenetetrahydrofolate reductase (NADPH)